MTKKTTSTFRQKICFCIWSGKQNCNYNWASVSLAVVGHAEPNEIYCSHHDCGIFYFSSLTVSLNSSIFGERNWLWAFCITSWMESCDGDYYIFCAFQVLVFGIFLVINKNITRRGWRRRNIEYIVQHNLNISYVATDITWTLASRLMSTVFTFEHRSEIGW